MANQNECFDVIEKTMSRYPEERIFLLIHNLDGGMLRSSKAQDVLSRLASIPNVHMLASVDHINAPLSKPVFLSSVKSSQVGHMYI